MFITQSVKIKINEKNIEHFKKLNYNVKLKDIVEIPTEHLNRGSQKYVDVKCDICGFENKIRFQSYMNNYENCDIYTCRKCSNMKIENTKLKRYGDKNYVNKKQTKQTNLEKYGVENVSQSDIIKEKKKETNLKNWGVENVFQSEEIKTKLTETLLEKYGVEHPLQNEELFEKSKQTCLKNNGVEYPTKSKKLLKIRNKNNLEKYGVEHYTQTDEYKVNVKETNIEKYGTEWYIESDEFKEKSINTNLEKYGVEYVMQNEEIFMKMQISGQKAKKYKETNLYYRGTYENHFLDLCFDRKINVEQGIRILYNYENKDRYYYSDFFIREYNLVIEIKSQYYFDKYLDMNISKKISTIDQGYNFMFIIDKKYDDFLQMVR